MGSATATAEADGRTIGELLEDARQRADITQLELFTLFKAEGGIAKQPNTIGDWLRSKSEPGASQYNILALVLNRKLEEAGQKPDLPLLGRFIRSPRSGSGSEPQMSYYGHDPFVSNVVALPPSHDLVDRARGIRPRAVAA